MTQDAPRGARGLREHRERHLAALGSPADRQQQSGRTSVRRGTTGRERAGQQNHGELPYTEQMPVTRAAAAKDRQEKHKGRGRSDCPQERTCGSAQPGLLQAPWAARQSRVPSKAPAWRQAEWPNLPGRRGQLGSFKSWGLVALLPAVLAY